MMNDNSTRGKREMPLKPRQELLLCRYFDNECGPISKIFAQRLLRNRIQARQFVDSLQKMATQCCNEENQDRSDCLVDMWSKVEARIEAEERAALYLGRRDHVDTAESFFSRVNTTQALFGGLSGAAVTAIALLVVVGPSERTDLPTIARGAPGLMGQGGAFTQVTLDNGTSSPRRARPAMVAGQAGSSMEVDWMRANGPLKFIQNPEGTSAIIWVRRRGDAETGAARRSKVTPIAQLNTGRVNTGRGDPALHQSR